MKYIRGKNINKFINEVLLKIKANKFNAQIIANSLSNTSLRGIDSHGIRLFNHYLDSFIHGRKNKNPKFKFNKKYNGLISLDADHSSGIVAGVKAINFAAKYAKKLGICAVSIYNSSHPGALSSGTLEAIKHNLICIGFANADNLILSPGGTRSFFGTNPISIVAPMKKKSPFCIDMSTSQISWNKLSIYKEKKIKVKDGVIVDNKGNKTTDPNEAKSLISIGKYKGYVLASAIEMLCSIYSGMPFGRQIDKMFTAPINKTRRLSQFYILLRTDGTITHKNFINSLSKMSNQVRDEPAKKNQIVKMPNDKENAMYKLRSKKGIPVDENLYSQLVSISKKYSIPLKFN